MNRDCFECVDVDAYTQQKGLDITPSCIVCGDIVPPQLTDWRSGYRVSSYGEGRRFKSDIDQ